jgi:hypothetical protein
VQDDEDMAWYVSGGGAEQFLYPFKDAAHSICKNVTFITTHNKKQWRRERGK